MKINRTIKRKSSAQAMVEFAIALPVLLLLLYGLLETGRYLFLYSTVVNASRQAVRYGSATGIGNNSVPRYQDCQGIRTAAQTGAYVATFDSITIQWDSGPADTSPTTYCTGTTDPSLTKSILSDNAHRIRVTIQEPYTPLLPKLVPFVARTITATSSRTILLSVSIEVTAPSVLNPSTPTQPNPTDTPTITPSLTMTPSATATPTRTNTPITYTPTRTFTPTITLTPSVTFTPSKTPTPSFTPTPSYTPTASATPISNCNLVSHGVENIAGKDFWMTITNNTGVPLAVSDMTVFWNHDGGSASGALLLTQITLDSSSFASPLTVWSGSVYSPSYTVIPDGLYLPTGQSTIKFTFNKNYQFLEGSERIFINLATNGCQTWPIDSDK